MFPVLGILIIHEQDKICNLDSRINPYLTNGFSHRYHLDESTFIFRGIGSDF